MAADANWRADALHLPLLDGVEFQPVFLLGDHRSGTTLLYRLLTNSGAFHSVTAYHLIRYERLLTDHLSGAAEESRHQLDALFHSLGLTTRRIDHTPLSADLPEEYGFFLLRATRRSKITRRNVSRFVEFCRKIQFISPGQHPLLLKNPWDYPNFLFLRAAFPTARFIFIHRDPYHVLNSQIKAARELLTEEDPYTSMLYEKYARIMRRAPARAFLRWYFSPPARRALRKLARGIAANACYYARHIGELPAGAYVDVGYEELCRQPDETIRRILVFAPAVPSPGFSCASEIAPRPVRLLPEVERVRPWLETIFVSQLAYFGYCS
jgi:hypothetical protein